MIGGDPPFFVLGAARSGTTLLRVMLDRHPRLAVPVESHFLIEVLREVPLAGELSRRQIERVADLIIGHRRFATWRTSEDELLRQLRRVGACDLQRLIDRVYRLEIAASGKPRWGDKTPRYYHCWRALAELFPAAPFVHLVRDGRDVAASLKRLGIHGWTPYGRARYWRSRVREARAALDLLGPRRCLIVRYEDLVLSTEATLRQVTAFLGEDYDPAMLRFYEDEHRLPAIDGPIHGKLARPPRAEDVARWQREGAWLDTLLFEAMAAKELARMGYPSAFRTRYHLILRLFGWLYSAAIRPLEAALYHGKNYRRRLAGLAPLDP